MSSLHPLFFACILFSLALPANAQQAATRRSNMPAVPTDAVGGRVQTCILFGSRKSLGEEIKESGSFKEARRKLFGHSEDEGTRIWLGDFQTVSGITSQQSLGSTVPKITSSTSNRGAVVRNLQYSDQGTAFTLTPQVVSNGTALVFSFESSFEASQSGQKGSGDDQDKTDTAALEAETVNKIRIEGAALVNDQELIVQEFQNNGQNLLIVLAYTKNDHEAPRRTSARTDTNTRYEKYVELLFERYDANNNGLLDPDEVKTMRRPPAGILTTDGSMRAVLEILKGANPRSGR
jgi:hypothetical protein